MVECSGNKCINAAEKWTIEESSTNYLKRERKKKPPSCSFRVDDDSFFQASFLHCRWRAGSELWLDQSLFEAFAADGGEAQAALLLMELRHEVREGSIEEVSVVSGNPFAEEGEPQIDHGLLDGWTRNNE